MKQMRQKTFKNSIILISSLMLTTASYGQRFIKQAGAGTQDGTSWDNALPASALTATLNGAGDVKVYIAAGEYEITSNIAISNKNFYLKGGYPANASGTDTSTYNHETNKSIIRETTSSSASRRFEFSVGAGANITNVHIQGLSFTGFDNTVSGPGVFDGSGGSGTINITLTEINAYNNKGGAGGVLRLASFTGANKRFMVNKCVFTGNTATSQGGVFYFTTVYRTPPGVSGGVRGGDDNPFIITNSAFRNNTANGWGGVFLMTTGADFLVANNYFCNDPGNLVSSGGSSASEGGILYWTTTNRITLSNNVFTGARVTGGNNSGAAVLATTIGNPGNLIDANRFFDNTGSTAPRADIYITTAQNLTITNNNFDKATQSDWLSGTATNATISNNSSNQTNFVPECPLDNVPLTVSLLSFEARNEKSNVNLLLWATASESSNLGFEIQRSYDGKNFSTIAFVKSIAENGNSNIPLNYEFRDFTSLDKKIYYRLIQQDFDNNKTTSKVIFISISNNSEEISIAPNPAKDNVSIIGLKGSGQIYIYDQMGKMVRTQQFVDISTDYRISLNHIDNGIYYVHVTDEDQKVIYRKMIIKID